MELNPGNYRLELSDASAPIFEMEICQVRNS